MTFDQWINFANSSFGSAIAGGIIGSAVGFGGTYFIYWRLSKAANVAALQNAKCLVEFYLRMIEENRKTIDFVKQRMGDPQGGLIHFQFDEIALGRDFPLGALKPTVAKSLGEILVGLFVLNNHLALGNLFLRETYAYMLGGSATAEILRDRVAALFDKRIPKIEQLADAETERLKTFHETLERELGQ